MVNTSLILFSAILSLLLWSFTGYHVCLVLHGCTTKETCGGEARRAQAPRRRAHRLLRPRAERRQPAAVGEGARDALPAGDQLLEL